MMLKWNDEDPVSQKEIDRNNGAFAHQNNRNPFIDSPQYVHRIWGGDCPGLSVLPVNLIYLTGKQNGKTISLQWQANKEIDLAKYVVEKSIDGSEFTSITTIKADGSYFYSYSDDIEYNSGNTVYYRLKKIDKNGVFNYSSVFKLSITSNNRVSVYPNPARNNINIKTDNLFNKPVEVILTDAMGRKVFQKTFISVNGQLNISTNNLSNGNYLLRVLTKENTLSRNLIIAK
jgi:hypothetical protein